MQSVVDRNVVMRRILVFRQAYTVQRLGCCMDTVDRGSISERERDFSLLRGVQTGYVANPDSCIKASKNLSLGKVAGA